MADSQQVIRYPLIIRYGHNDRDLNLFLQDVFTVVKASAAVVVSGPHTCGIFGESVIDALSGRIEHIRCEIAVASDERTVQRIQKNAQNAEIVVSIGGGRVIDTGKMAAHRLNLPFVSVPTVLSNDGIASPVAVIDGMSRFTSPPLAVYVPLDIIKSAPINHIRAGIGDLISNISATLDWELAHAEVNEPIVDIAVLLARGGAFAVLTKPRSITELEYLERLAAGLIQSGLAMELAGSSRPASGAEHKISHAIDALFRDKVNTLHGEQTALGTLIAQFIRGKEIDHLIQLFKHIGLPYHWHQIGLDDHEMAEVMAHAAAKIRRERFTVLEKMDIDLKSALELLTAYHEAVM